MHSIRNKVDEKVTLGIIWADAVDVQKYHTELETRLSQLLAIRMKSLTESEENFRKACRDMLRNGSYKPTGRGKPASEYLLREAMQGNFPRINTLVDINNYISLKYSVPISLWDRQKINSESCIFRPGNEGESFIFNLTGQTIQLRDLVTGFAVCEGKEVPIITPIKDSQLTKTDVSTSEIGVAIYYPAVWNGVPSMGEIMDEFSGLLSRVSDNLQIKLE